MELCVKVRAFYILSKLTMTFVPTVQNTPVGNCSNGDVRLAGGSNALEGRVEICFNNAWGTVCGDTFSNYDAHVVCTSIGHPFNGRLTSKSHVPWCVCVCR